MRSQISMVIPADQKVGAPELSRTQLMDVTKPQGSKADARKQKEINKRLVLFCRSGTQTTNHIMEQLSLPPINAYMEGTMSLVGCESTGTVILDTTVRKELDEVEDSILDELHRTLVTDDNEALKFP